MSHSFPETLLSPHEPLPFEVLNESAEGGIVIVCDHGGRRMPQCFARNGLPEPEGSSHIAWDIGARDIAIRMADELNAVLVCGVYSRLVVDLNRYPWSQGAMPAVSDGTPIPFNVNLAIPEIQLRIDEFHRPYHSAVQSEIARARRFRKCPVLISVHTMTDRLSDGATRAEEFAVLWSEHDATLSREMLEWLSAHGGGVVGNNTPYSLDVGVDFTVPEHGFRQGLNTFMFEVRQDLVSSRETAHDYANILAAGLQAVLGKRKGVALHA